MGPPADATDVLEGPVGAGTTAWAHAWLRCVDFAAEALEASLVCLLENVSIQVLLQTVLLGLMSSIQYLLCSAINACILVVLLRPVEREALLHSDCELLLRLVAKLVARMLIFRSEEVLVVDLWQIARYATHFLSLGLQTGFFGEGIASLRGHVLNRSSERARHVHLLWLVDTF